MKGLFEIIAAGIGLLFLTSIVIFVYSIVGKWRMVYKIYFGFTTVLLSHILLFYVAAFGENFPLPVILSKYALGILNFLATLIPV
jgi:hypothetical protein